jgi:putative transposase
MKFDEEVIADLVKGVKTQEDLFGKNGLIKTFIKQVVEKSLNAEMTEHLGYEDNSSEGYNTGNSRNGKTSKKLHGDFGEVKVDVPRDRESSFEPKILPKRQKRIDGFDDKIISLYARGMSTRDIQGQIKDLYEVEVSPNLISNITDSVLDDVKAWQNRTLDALYPIVYMDALVVKIQDNGKVINKAIYLALGIDLNGNKELLGMWISKTEGAKFWLNVLTELKNRGLDDVFYFCIDGLKGFPQAIESVYPQSNIQLCIVHQIRNSVKFVSYKDRKAVCADLKPVYQAPTEEAALEALEEFGEKWNEQYPAIYQQWERNWSYLSTFFSQPGDIRKILYTTNSIESVNSTIRKVIKNKRVFPSNESAFKILYLAINNISKKWSMPVKDWPEALNRFSIEFSDRMPSNW